MDAGVKHFVPPGRPLTEAMGLTNGSKDFGSSVLFAQ